MCSLKKTTAVIRVFKRNPPHVYNKEKQKTPFSLKYTSRVATNIFFAWKFFVKKKFEIICSGDSFDGFCN